MSHLNIHLSNLYCLLPFFMKCSQSSSLLYVIHQSVRSTYISSWPSSYCTSWLYCGFVLLLIFEVHYHCLLTDAIYMNMVVIISPHIAIICLVMSIILTWFHCHFGNSTWVELSLKYILNISLSICVCLLFCQTPFQYCPALISVCLMCLHYV